MPTPRAVRYLGLLGSALTGLSAYLGGAGFVRGHNLNLVRLFDGHSGVALPVCWLVGLALLLYAWWTGRHVVPSTRWALVTAGLWMLPLLPFLPLGSEDVYSYACQGWVQYAGGDPYATSPLAFGCPWLSSMAQPWLDSPAPYGPLFLLVSTFVGHVGGSLAGAIVGFRLLALVGVALIAVAVPALARRAGTDPARATWIVLAVPLTLIHFVSGVHNDALMVGLLVAGLAVVAGATRRAGHPDSADPPTVVPGLRSSPAPAGLLLAGGALLGLAVGVKATAAVVLPFAVLAEVRPGSALRALWRPAALIGGGAGVALAALSLVSGRGVGWVNGLLRSGDTVEWTSPSTAVGITVSRLLAPFGTVHAVPPVRLIGTIVLVPVLVAIWWRARAGGALMGAGLALAATVVLAPVFHPWYAMWPLAVLAATWTGPEVTFTRWVLAPCAAAAALTLPDGFNIALQTRTQGAVLMTAGLVVLAIRTVRRRRRGDTVPGVLVGVGAGNVRGVDGRRVGLDEVGLDEDAAA